MVLASGLDLLWLHVLLELPALLQLLGLPGLVLVHEFWAPGQCQWFLMRCFSLYHEFQVEPVLLTLLWLLKLVLLRILGLPGLLLVSEIGSHGLWGVWCGVTYFSLIFRFTQKLAACLC